MNGENWYAEEQATLGDRLAAAREAAGLSQSALAARLGVRLNTLRGWENDLSEPRANRLQMLAAMLGVSLPWLLTGQGEGVSAPDAATVAGGAMAAALADLRAIRAELHTLAERAGQVEKRLRVLAGGGDA